MFKKEKCPKCKRKISDKYSFCPYCGTSTDSENQQDWGMLGKNDIESLTNDIKLPLGFNTIFNSLMKNLTKELEGQFKEEPQKKTIKKDGVSISISTFGNGAPRVKVTELGKNPSEKKEIPKFKQSFFTKEKAQKFSESEKEEPKTNIRRLANKVVYELEMPDVQGVEDISIIKLENSIEIKAIGKKKSYSKLIPINLPIKTYDLSDGKLTLELAVKG